MPLFRSHTRRLPKALTADELDALRAVAKNARDQALVETLAGCGLRVSEACDLRLDDVHWSSDSPSLRFVGKRDKERVVPMNLEVQDALRTWLDIRGANHSEYVFCNLRTGGRLSRKTVWDAMQRYSRRAGIRRVHPHMLRHSFGTGLADRDVPVERIRELMGHSSIQTSQIYITVSTEQKRKAVERLDRRHKLVRWVSKQRNRSYRFFGRPSARSVTFTRGETVGRQAELKQLQDNVTRGIDTLLIGPVGVGKSHLLGLLEGEQLIRLPGLTPPRQTLISMAEELFRKGEFRISPEGGEEDRGRLPRVDGSDGNGEPQEPTGTDGSSTERGEREDDPSDSAPGSVPGPDLEKSQNPEAQDGAPKADPELDFEAFKKQHTRTSVRGWTQLVCDAVEKDAWTLVVDDLSDLTTSTGRLIDRLADKFRVVAGLHEVKKPYEKHFWKFERVEIGPLPPADARRLIRQASAGVEIEDPRLLETHLLQKTNGNPRAILESVERLRKEPAVTRHAVRELTHTGAQQQFDMTPIVVIPIIGIMAFRFIARGMGDMDFYLFAGVGSALAMGIRFFLFRSSRK